MWSISTLNLTVLLLLLLQELKTETLPAPPAAVERSQMEPWLPVCFTQSEWSLMSHCSSSSRSHTLMWTSSWNHISLLVPAVSLMVWCWWKEEACLPMLCVLSSTVAGITSAWWWRYYWLQLRSWDWYCSGFWKGRLSVPAKVRFLSREVCYSQCLWQIINTFISSLCFVRFSVCQKHTCDLWPIFQEKEKKTKYACVCLCMIIAGLCSCPLTSCRHN